MLKSSFHHGYSVKDQIFKTTLTFDAENFNSQRHRNNIGLDSQYLHLNWMFEIYLEKTVIRETENESKSDLWGKV
ncbi:hypothetical protein T12_4566 [Trichinella patagoniensis]|uniref:Uncharacterized protein n=1 Tax=Trichinella patagoniensis TaxID=990121 RepID=A0A0V1AGC8_9BILA|nr:hypothetical protein T12_4566 [Trichinella patagoniensis]